MLNFAVTILSNLIHNLLHLSKKEIILKIAISDKKGLFRGNEILFRGEKISPKRMKLFSKRIKFSPRGINCVLRK